MIKHVAFIVDGNRRWARSRGLPSIEGHRKGFSRVREIIQAGYDLKIPNLSFFLFSTENWKRSESEVTFLMNLAESVINSELSSLLERGIRLKHIGRTDRIPSSLLNLIQKAEELTINERKMILNLALDYGGKDEIVRATKFISSKVKEGKLDINEINEESFKSYLDTNLSPPVDLLIRTSGEFRISNFLLYDIAYSELYFSKQYFPDFTKEEFIKILEEYYKRERRYGK